MSSMFENCKSLKSLPDIAKWQTNRELINNFMFKGCAKNIVPKKFK